MLYRDPTGHKFIAGYAEEGSERGPRVYIVGGGRNIVDDFATRARAYSDVAALFLRWLTETGPEHVASGPKSSFVQLLQHEEGVNAVREEFKTRGCPSGSFGRHYDAQQWGTFAREMVQALTGDPVGAFLGSYDVEILNDRGGEEVEIHVYNLTSRESFLRFPGIGPLLQRKSREQTQGLDNWGGDMDEDFWWYEPNPCPE